MLNISKIVHTYALESDDSLDATSKMKFMTPYELYYESNIIKIYSEIVLKRAMFNGKFTRTIKRC